MTTPGPWHVPKYAWWQILPADGLAGDTVIARVYECAHSRRDRDEATANAHLIAAAPELLEALHELWACVETYDEFNDPGHDWYSLRWQVRDAIAKAEGRKS